MNLMGFRTSHRLKSNDIEAGCTFRSQPANGVVEIARVLSIMPDCMGIPHVRFQIKVQQKSYGWFEDYRTLNITSFMARFPVRHDLEVA